jgi:hypothetical protein
MHSNRKSRRCRHLKRAKYSQGSAHTMRGADAHKHSCAHWPAVSWDLCDSLAGSQIQAFAYHIHQRHAQQRVHTGGGGSSDYAFGSKNSSSL